MPQAEAAGRRAAPGPRGYPLVGDLPGFLRDKLGFLTRMATRYGDVVQLRLGETTFLLSHPEDVKHILITNPGNYDKTPRLTSPRGRRLSGRGLLTSVGEEHLVRRRLLQPAFHRSAMEPFGAEIVRETQRLMEGWRDGTRLDVAAAMMRLTQRNIVNAVFGAELADHSSLAAAIAVRRRYMEHVFFSPLGGRLPSRIGRAYRAAMRHIVAVVDDAIARRRRDPGAHDLLSALVHARGEDGRSLTDEQIRDEAITLLVTGHETVGEALGWTWYLLGRHPDAEAALGAEVDRLLVGRPPGADDVRELRWASLVLAESMRLYPPTWIFIRMARDADTLPSGATIPPGAKIYLCPWVMHRHPRWFPDPERFDPERFADAQRRERPQLAYFPFGAGARLCIGEALARMEGVLILATIAQRFRLAPLAGHAIVPEPRMTLRPRGGIPVEVHERARAGATARLGHAP